MFMHMSMKFTCQATILFPVFTSEDCAGFSIILILAFLLGLLTEFMFFYKDKIIGNSSNNEVNDNNNDNDNDNNLENSAKSKNYILKSLFYFSLILLSNLTMFFLMSYNFYVFLTIILSNLIGFILFEK